MARLNVRVPILGNITYEGAPAAQIKPMQALRRSVLSCLLWEDEFYESGQEISARIQTLVSQLVGNVNDRGWCDSIHQRDIVAINALAIEARTKFNLRHVPLYLLSVLGKLGALRWGTVAQTVWRADELTELLAIHAKVNKTTPDKIKKHIPAQMKKGLAHAFGKFDEYQLGKYDRSNQAIRLRDVLFLTHAKPADEAQAALWKRLVANELAVPDTWETNLSVGADKKETFTRLIQEGKLGYLALLRNLRGMLQAGVDESIMEGAIVARRGGAERVLPFRFIAAARACPRMEKALDKSLQKCIADLPPLSGRTLVLVDVSSSMHARLSSKSDLRRCDAAAALAALINGDLRVFSFSDRFVEVPHRMGMAGVDAILNSQANNGTELIAAVAKASQEKHDRIIVISDEQAAHDSTYGRLPAPKCNNAYMINVASAKNGIGYGKWTHVDGFSENVIRFVHEYERDNAPVMENAMG